MPQRFTDICSFDADTTDDILQCLIYNM